MRSRLLKRFPCLGFALCLGAVVGCWGDGGGGPTVAPPPDDSVATAETSGPSVKARVTRKKIGQSGTQSLDAATKVVAD